MNIAKFLEAGMPETLIRACIATRRYLKRDNVHGLKVDSDRWVYDLGHYRPIMLRMIKGNWGELVGLPPHECPFRDDMIVHICICTRKNNETHEQLASRIGQRNSELVPQS